MYLKIQKATVRKSNIKSILLIIFVLLIALKINITFLKLNTYNRVSVLYCENWEIRHVPTTKRDYGFNFWSEFFGNSSSRSSKNYTNYNIGKSLTTTYAQTYKTKEECLKYKKKFIQNRNIRNIFFTIIILFDIWAIYLLLILSGALPRYYKKKLKPKIIKNYKDIKTKIQLTKIRHIAENESIRRAAGQIIKNDDNHAQELQSIINKAISKGDTETAQALLKILNKTNEK